MSLMRAVVLQSNIDDAHQAKVVALLREIGWSVTRFGFRRDYYRGDASRLADVQNLGYMAHGSVLARLPVILRALREIRNPLRHADVAFAFGADMHLLAWLATDRRKVIHLREVADIPRILSAGSVSAKLARALERWSMRHVDCLIVTSDAFVRSYYRDQLRREPGLWHELPNKISPGHAGSRPAPDLSIGAGPITIGYFGLIRCRRSLEILSMLAARAPETHRVVLRGHLMTDFPVQETVERLPNFEYLGPYDSPRQLAELYAACDLVWSCYPFEPANRNAALAKTNRFYEACYFRRPQVAQQGTQDADMVHRLGIGQVVQLLDPEATIRQLLQIDRDDLREMRRRIEVAPPDVCTYHDEMMRLNEIVCGLVMRGQAERTAR
jgi:succinoglycan biosynthesis protein ExoL